MEDFEHALAALDVSLFDHVRTQTAPWDQVVLLALHNACREVHGTFRYLEIGSHRGGSLQVLIRDPRCVEIVSIDLRPAVVPDATRGEYSYSQNTTARMLEHLRAVPGADLAKLRTYDASTAELDDVGDFRPQLCFVDGEHTHAPALADARFCLRVMNGEGVIAFHDSGAVETAIEEFVAELGEPYHSLELPRSIRIIEIGRARLIPVVRRLIDSFARTRPTSRSSRSAP